MADAEAGETSRLLKLPDEILDNIIKRTITSNLEASTDDSPVEWRYPDRNLAVYGARVAAELHRFTACKRLYYMACDIIKKPATRTINMIGTNDWYIHGTMGMHNLLYQNTRIIHIRIHVLVIREGRPRLHLVPYMAEKTIMKCSALEKIELEVTRETAHHTLFVRWIDAVMKGIGERHGKEVEVVVRE